MTLTVEQVKELIRNDIREITESIPNQSKFERPRISYAVAVLTVVLSKIEDLENGHNS